MYFIDVGILLYYARTHNILAAAFVLTEFLSTYVLLYFLPAAVIQVDLVIRRCIALVYNNMHITHAYIYIIIIHTRRRLVSCRMPDDLFVNNL